MEEDTFKTEYQCQGSFLSNLSTCDKSLAEDIFLVRDDVAGYCWMWNDLLPCHPFFCGKSSDKAIYHSATHLFISTCLSRFFQHDTSTDFIPQTTWGFTQVNVWLWSFDLQVSTNLLPPPSNLYLGIQEYSKFHHLLPQNHKDFMIKSSPCCNTKKFPGACLSFRPMCHNNVPLTKTTIVLH